jgi:hypothetical protein
MSTAVEQTLYRSVVDEDFRALLMGNPGLFGLSSHDCPKAVEAEVQEGLAVTAMTDVDLQACDSSCSYGQTVVCDKSSN